jgi:hypothetical protein
MEDYHAAFLQRFKDTEILHTSSRKVAAMHLGGVTVECLLKSMILAALPKNVKREWKTDFNDPGHTISNPGHSLKEALKRHNRLNSRIDKFPLVRGWIERVENPSQHFINLRYIDTEPEDLKYKEWWFAYISLVSWLKKQATQL